MITMDKIHHMHTHKKECDIMKTFVYKKTDNCAIRGELFCCNKKEAPLIVYIHGGGLVWGSRTDLKKEQVNKYTNAGFHVFSIDYRLAPETKLPNIANDVADAIRWLHTEGTEAIGFDATRMAVIGSSAGGYLALLSGTFAVRPKAIVSFYGYGDIVGDWYTTPSNHYQKMPAIPESFARQLVQNRTISEAPIELRYAIYLYCRQQGKWLDYVFDTDSAHWREELKLYQPMMNIDSSFPATLLIHGDADQDVPYKESIKMHTALQQAGIETELITIPGGKHVFDDDMNNPVVAETYDKVIAFLQQHV